MNPKVYAGFLAPWYVKTIQDAIMNDTFPWYYKPSITLDEKPKYTCDTITFAKNQSGFGHMFYSDDRGGKISPYFDILTPFINACAMQIPEVQINKLIRVRGQLTVNNGENAVHYPHVDFNYPHKTILLYLNNSSGNTIMFKEFYKEGKDITKLTYDTEYKPQENTIVLFDGLQYHSSSFPTENDFRYVINLNYIWYNLFYGFYNWIFIRVFFKRN